MGKGFVLGSVLRVILVGAILFSFIPLSGGFFIEKAYDGIGEISIKGYHDIRAGSGVTEIKLLSDYLESLKGTNGDTQIFVLEGEKEGPTTLILGGTHGNEIAGISAAILLIERAQVEAGKLIIIPVANYSASTNVDTMRPDVKEFTLMTPSGPRTFRYGARRTNPVDQVYTNEPFVPYEGQVLPAEESGNLNRVYPGDPNGNLTQQVAYAIMEIIRNEKVDIAVDMHEAGPTNGLSYSLICNPNVIDLCIYATLFRCEDYGFSMRTDFSSIESIGLSHREWGDRTEVAAFLIETPNPGQETEESYGKMDVVNDPIHPLGERVGIQIYTIISIFDSYEHYNGKQTIINNLPTYEELFANGVGQYLN